MTKVTIIESEAGWGQKIDEIKEFDTHEEAEIFCKDYNTEHNPPKDKAPDWYMFAKIAGCPLFGMLTWTDEEWEERQRILMIGKHAPPSLDDDEIDDDKIDAELFREGTYVCMMTNVSKEEMNRLCREMRKSPWNLRVDWHYAGGRIVVKCLDCTPQQVLNHLPQVLPA